MPLMAIITCLAAISGILAVCCLIGKLAPARFKTSPIADLQSGRVAIDMNELDARMASDTRTAREVCKAERGGTRTIEGQTFHIATACWWPFCDCGEQ